MSNIIVMAFSPRNIMGCFLKKRLTKGGLRAPQDLRLATSLLNIFFSALSFSDGSTSELRP